MIHLNLDMPHLQIPKLQSALSCGLLRLVVAHLCKEQKKDSSALEFDSAWLTLGRQYLDHSNHRNPKMGRAKYATTSYTTPSPTRGAKPCFLYMFYETEAAILLVICYSPFFCFGWIIYNNVTTISPSQSHFISGNLCSQTGCCPHVFPSFQQGEAPQLWVGL